MAEHHVIWVDLNGQNQCTKCQARESNGGLDQPCPWSPPKSATVDNPPAATGPLVTANLDVAEINFQAGADIGNDGRIVLAIESIEPRAKDAVLLLKDSLGRTYSVVTKAKELYKQVKSARDEGRGRLRTSKLDARRRR